MRTPVYGYLSLALTLFVGCTDPLEVRRYQEMASAPAPVAVVAGGPSWTAPDGWIEQPGEGMRLATFIVGEGEQALEATLTSFPGDVGGLHANLARWAGQLGIEPDDDAMHTFIDTGEGFQTAGGFDGFIFDFARYPGREQGEGESMLASIITRGDARVFIKMTGPVLLLEKEREAFLQLSRSVK